MRVAVGTDSCVMCFSIWFLVWLMQLRFHFCVVSFAHGVSFPPLHSSVLRRRHVFRLVSRDMSVMYFLLIVLYSVIYPAFYSSISGDYGVSRGLKGQTSARARRYARALEGTCVRRKLA